MLSIKFPKYIWWGSRGSPKTERPEERGDQDGFGDPETGSICLLQLNSLLNYFDLSLRLKILKSGSYTPRHEN